MAAVSQTASGIPRLDEIREYWNSAPVGRVVVKPPQDTVYDFFRSFDAAREVEEPYHISNYVHDYEGSRQKRVLDYGCGNGYVLGHYARNGAETYGVDITPQAIELSRLRFRLLGVDGEFVLNDGNSIPFDDEFFDIACSMGVLHHIPDPAPVVAELYRVLKPGGRLVIMLYNRNSFRYWVTFRYRRRFDRRYRGHTLQEVVNMNDGDDNPYAVAYTKDDVRELLSSFTGHEFLIQKLHPDELGLYRPKLGRAIEKLLPGRIPLALGRRFGWNLYCTAHKPG